MPPRPRSFWLLLGLWVAACDCGPAPRVGGPQPYVRCALADVPASDPLTRGAVSLTREDRSLRLEGASPFLAYGVGPGATRALKQLPERRVHLVLGGFARTPEEAEGFLRVLGEHAALALLLPGGEDDAAIWANALDDAPAHLVDLAPYRELALPGGRFSVVPGAPSAYARGDGSCGFGLADLALLDADEAEGHRWLLAWTAPRRSGPGAVDLGYGAVHAGDARVAALFARLGAVGGVYGWPRTQAGRGASPRGEVRVPSSPAPDLEVVVPLLGTAVERFDGSLLPSGALELAAGPSGLEVRSFLRARVESFARERGHSDR